MEINPQTDLISLSVSFYSFRKTTEEGVIVVHKNLANDVRELFDLMLRNKFPLESVIPVDNNQFSANDALSMQANNTSGFNRRNIAGTDRLSNHAFGRAIDINPKLNPYIHNAPGESRRIVEPSGAVYDISKPGTITKDSFIVQFLEERGWIWGGDWQEKDYQHFEKSF